MRNPRESAVRALEKIEDGAYSNLVLNQVLAAKIEQRDRSLITELVYGVVQNKLRLDYIISEFSKTKIKKLSSVVLAALRVGVYQILFLDRVPDFAAVSESVNIVKKLKGQRIANFANGVLRSVSANKDNICYPDRQRDPQGYISVFYSFPLWLIKRWIDFYGVGFTEELCKALNERPKMCVRVNTLKTKKGDLMLKLKEEGITSSEGLLMDEALYFREALPLHNLSSFKEGLFQPQDEGSMLVARLAGARRGETILDVASAPGGKASHIAQLMADEGEIIAWDIHPQRVELIKETCNRLGITIVKAKLQDALSPRSDLTESFDKVIVDAPCSGLGVIRRKPDIKWTKVPEDISSLAGMQLNMLSTVSSYVKPGGTLIYSTCSIDPEENREVVEKFLQCYPEFRFDDIEDLLPDSLRGNKDGEKGFINLYPHIHDVDGFFIARLQKSPFKEMSH